MKKIAEGSGVAILEEPTRLRFVRFAHETAHVGAFVLGLLTGSSVLALTQQLLGAGAWTGLLWTLGAVALTGTPLVLILRHIHHGRRDLDSSPTVAVIDLAARQLLDGDGKRLASLDEVGLHTELQLLSSAPRLVARYGKGQRLVLAKGDPFGGGIAALVLALRERGLMR